MTGNSLTATKSTREAGASAYVDRNGDPQPAGTSELAWLGLYFAGILTMADVLNVRLGVELLTLMVAVAAVAITRAPLPFLREWWFFLAGLLLWNASGPIAAASPFQPHLDFMLNLDRWLFHGQDFVAVVQHRWMRPGVVGPLDVAAAVTYNLHLPEPYIAAYFLWRLNRIVYFQFVTAALALLVLGFLFFVFVPAIPPWMASLRFHRLNNVVNGFGPVLHWHPLPFHGTPLFYFFKWRGDAVAAFPSEHAALPLLELMAFWFCGRRYIAAGLFLWVLWVLFAILYLGEHWITDALAGWILAIAVFASVRKLTRSAAP